MFLYTSNIPDKVKSEQKFLVTVIFLSFFVYQAYIKSIPNHIHNENFKQPYSLSDTKFKLKSKNVLRPIYFIFI